MKELNLGFMSSHGGSNMQVVLDSIQKGELKARPCVLISNNSKSKAIERAESVHMPYFHISQFTHPDPIDHDNAIVEILESHDVEYLLLLGLQSGLSLTR